MYCINRQGLGTAVHLQASELFLQDQFYYVNDILSVAPKWLFLDSYLYLHKLLETNEIIHYFTL